MRALDGKLASGTSVPVLASLVVGGVLACGGVGRAAGENALFVGVGEQRALTGQVERLLEDQDPLERWLEAVGIGTMPALGLALSSTLRYWRAPAPLRSKLPYFFQPGFFVPLWFLVFGLAVKDTVLSPLAPVKTPLDILGMGSQLGAFVLGVPYTATLVLPRGTTTAPAGSLGLDVLLLVTMLLFYGCVFATGWVFDALVILSPIPFVDTVLHSLRVSTLALFFVAAHVHPTLGLLVVGPVLLLSFLLVRWTVRLLRMTLRFAGDILRRRWQTAPVLADGVEAFACTGVLGVRAHQQGVLRAGPEGLLSFDTGASGPRSRRRPIDLGEARAHAIGRGPLAPYLMRANRRGRWERYLRFPPIFRGHEEAVARALGVASVLDVSPASGILGLLGILRTGGSSGAPPLAGAH